MSWNNLAAGARHSYNERVNYRMLMTIYEQANIN